MPKLTLTYEITPEEQAEIVSKLAEETAKQLASMYQQQCQSFNPFAPNHAFKTWVSGHTTSGKPST